MKNKKSLIMNFVVLALCVLTLVFLCFPAIGAPSGWLAMSESGYVGVPVIYLTILVCWLLISTLLAILADFNVIKNEKFAKIVDKISTTIAILLAFLYTVVITQMAKLSFVSPGEWGWASLVNIIIDLIAVVLVIVNNKVIKRK